MRHIWRKRKPRKNKRARMRTAFPNCAKKNGPLSLAYGRVERPNLIRPFRDRAGGFKIAPAHPKHAESEVRAKPTGFQQAVHSATGKVVSISCQHAQITRKVKCERSPPVSSRQSIPRPEKSFLYHASTPKACETRSESGLRPCGSGRRRLLRRGGSCPGRRPVPHRWPR